MGTAANVIAGPGLLYVGLASATEPTDAVTPLGTAFKAVGYTEDGNDFDWSVTREKLYVAESPNPIRSYTTKQEGKLKVAMAEATSQNLRIALNKFDAAALPGDAVEPPATSAEVRMMVVLDTDDGARWLFRRCVIGGSFTIPRKKAPKMTTLGVEFELEEPTSGAKMFKVFPNASGLI